MFREFGTSHEALSLIKPGSDVAVTSGALDAAAFLVSSQQASCLNDSLVKFYVFIRHGSDG